MTDTTLEYWDCDGESLQTYTRNLEQWGVRHGVPALRGGDTLVPYVPGERWRRKVPGPRVIVLAGWVIGGTELEYRYNWRETRRLLWRTGRQVAITKRWRSLDGLTTYSATALAEHQGGMEPEGFSSQGAKFTCDMKLAFPYFKGPVITSAPLAGAFTVDNVGDDTTRLVTLTFSESAVLINTTTGKTLVVPGACVVDVRAWTTSGDYEGLLTYGEPEEPFWMTLARGENEFTLSDGTVTISYTPLYV